MRRREVCLCRRVWGEQVTKGHAQLEEHTHKDRTAEPIRGQTTQQNQSGKGNTGEQGEGRVTLTVFILGSISRMNTLILVQMNKLQRNTKVCLSNTGRCYYMTYFWNRSDLFWIQLQGQETLLLLVCWLTWPLTRWCNSELFMWLTSTDRFNASRTVDESGEPAGSEESHLQESPH